VSVSRTITDHIVDSMDTILRMHPHSGVVVLGDFNRLNDKPLYDYPLKQVVKSATRKTGIFDKIYTSLSE